MNIEGFDNLTPVGSGGFSQVFRAEEVRFGRTVAAKVLNFMLDEADDRIRFERECRAMAQLSDHPSIVPLYSTTYTDDGYPVIIMEYFAGGTLWARARRGAGLDDLLSAGVKIASALHTAHERNVMHRDVKPQNVLMSRFGEPGLTDFGISAFDRHHADHGRPRGITVAYASPEALNGASSARTDVYSLAATLYTVLADQRPYDIPGKRQSTAELARRIANEDPPPLQQFGYSAAVDHAIRRIGMARPTGQRPATAAAFGDILRTLEEREGFEPTPWLEARDLTADTSSSTILDQTDSRAIIHLPSSNSVDIPDLTTPPSTSRRRRLISTLAGLVVAGLVAALAISAAVGDPEPEATPAPIPTPFDDGFNTTRPLGPGDIEIVRTETGARLDWTDANANPVGFEVQPWRSGTVVGERFSASGVFVEFDPGTETCFVMRAVGEGGRGAISLDSEPVCLPEPARLDAGVSTPTCDETTCAYLVKLPSAVTGTTVAVSLTDPFGVDPATTDAGAYEQQATVNETGVVEWAHAALPDAAPGTYLLRIVSQNRATIWSASVEIAP